MNRKKDLSGRKPSVLPAFAGLGLILLAAALTFGIGPLGSVFSPVGIVHASEEDRQKDLEDPATPDDGADASESEGLDALSDLIEEQPIDREYLRAIAARVRAVEKRELELDRREKELEVIQSDILRLLADLKSARSELLSMTREVDEARTKEIKDAVKRFKAMEVESAAKILIQTDMDLESAMAILKALDAEAVGGIFDAMVEETDAMADEAVPGMDSKQDRQKRIKDIWEHWMNPDMPFESSEPDTMSGNSGE